MIYTVLFLGLPILGVAAFTALWIRMERAGIAAPPVGAFFAVFAGYGAVLLFGVSEIFGAWSAMHSLAASGILLVGIPWLLIQGTVLHRSRRPSRYHQTAAKLSLGFPIAVAALLGLALLG